MFFPLSDDDSELTGPGLVTVTLIVINVILFAVQAMSPEFTQGWSAVPKEITTGNDLTGTELLVNASGQVMVDETGQPIAIAHSPGPPLIYLTILSAMFMHGGLMHIGGNMLYLWIFGDNVEHRFGSIRFLIFYLVSGLAATFAQIAQDPQSIIPTLGASGAISGVMGAYLVLFPKNRVNALFFFRLISVPAVVVLGMWIVLQVFEGSTARGQIGGVAYAAHIGGFVAGVLAGLVARLFMRGEPNNRRYERYVP